MSELKQKVLAALTSTLTSPRAIAYKLADAAIAESKSPTADRKLIVALMTREVHAILHAAAARDEIAHSAGYIHTGQVIPSAVDTVKEQVEHNLANFELAKDEVELSTTGYVNVFSTKV
ncbi:coil containing protein [Vibrio phage 1.081.O._10N.286.52.C2]|nr:coil containing protein [Vibrio phage 1.081.O._10N.286.52.C2]